MSSRIALTAILILGASASADAQNPYIRNPSRWEREHADRQRVVVQPAEVKGAVEGIAPGIIAVLDAHGRAWRVGVRGAKVQVTGTADADYLRTGMTVEFKGNLDGKGALTEKVDELKIVTPSPGESPGLFPADSGAEGEAKAANGKPARRSTATKGLKGGAVAPGMYRIVGRLVVEHGGKLLVLAGRNKLALELADPPKIDVAVTDLSLVARGDKISAKGFRIAPRGGTMIGQLKAADVTIELSEPLAGPEKNRAAARPDTKRSPKRDTPEGPRL